MMSKNFIVTNFAYGTGPYLRTTDLAIAFNDELERAGKERLDIIVPWVYGEKQKKIMLEEFSDYEQKHAGELLFDAELGAILKSVFYETTSFEKSLASWIERAEEASQKANRHLSGKIQLETLSGETLEVDGRNIVVELNRSPRIRYDIAPSYFTSFAYIAEILNRALAVQEISIKHDLLKSGIVIADKIEKNQKIHAIAYPATFSYLKDRQPRYPSEIEVPPIMPLPRPNSEQIEAGIFVTISGIPGLERLYAEAAKLGVKIYTNDPKAVPAGIKALPNLISNKNILFHFARSGWSSVWASMISGMPLVVPDFDPKDDPEIYFNNRTIEELEIGIVYRNQPLNELLKERERIKKASAKVCKEILKRWGTLDGNQYCAGVFAKDFLK